MAVVDFTQCQKICLALLNAGPDDYSFSVNVGDERFGTLGAASDQVKEAILAADEQVVLAILETEGHWARPDYVDWSGQLDYLDEIPTHVGKTGQVEILVSNGGAYVPGVPATIEEIRMWRGADSSSFGSKAHNASGSAVAGYFAIRDNVVQFTGYRLAVKLGTYTRTSVCQAPAIYQLTVWAMALTYLFPKEGSWLQKAAFLAGQVANQMAAIRGNLVVAPELESYEEVKG
jgi:hypothetical protein